MPITITKPTVGGSNGTWGTELNTALDTIVTGVNNLETNASGIPASTVTTKGDLIAGTGNGTITRQAAGSNGTVLLADNTYSTGMRWGLAPGSVVARFTNTAGQSLANATPVALTWNTITYDRHGTMSSGNATYYPGIAGYYEFAGGVSFVSNTTGMRMCYWNVDGSQYTGSATTENAVTGGFQTSMCARTIIVNLTASQGVSLYAYQSSGGALSTAASGGHMSAMTVRWLGAS